MNTRIATATAVLALSAASFVHATNARVESMGKNDTYFMDDISVWSNPANANIYPNYLFGELGQASGAPDSVKAATNNYTSFARYNQDPSSPWFGAVFAKSFSSDKEAGNRFPQVVIGGAFNRKDELLAYLPTKIDSGRVVVPSIVSHTDALLGMALTNGVKLGMKGYVALSDSTNTNYEGSAYVYSGILGINAPVGAGVDVEATLGLASIGADIVAKDDNGVTRKYQPEGGISLMATARGFIALPAIQGQLVPALSFAQIDAPSIEDTKIRVGSGVNVTLDRGFFWLGLDYFQKSTDYRQLADSSTTVDANFVNRDEVGARFSFGIERNIWWDWFVIRVGGQKVVSTVEVTDKTTGTPKESSYWKSNPEADGTANDMVSFGFGLNIEDKLKVDAVVAEDLLYNGGNLLGGPVDHIFTRISASYSF